MKDTNLIIGKVNTGKTKTILFNEVKNLIEKEENLFIYDNRDEYYQEFYSKLQEKKYNIKLLNLKDTTKSNGFNPLSLPYKLYKEGKKDKSMNMLNTLALEIFKEDRNTGDPFWENMASNYFMGLVLILFKEANEKEINIGSVQAMINQADEVVNGSTVIKGYLDNLDVVDPIYTLLSSIVFSPNDTKGSILSVLKQKLNVYVCREQLLNLLSINEIELDNLEDKSAIFVIGDGKSAISNIFIGEFIQSIENKKFNIIIDNLDSLPILMNFKEIIMNTSYLNNKLFVSIHNFDEMKDKYGKYIFDSFQNVIETKEDSNYINNIEVNYNVVYPELEMKNLNYFVFKK